MKFPIFFALFTFTVSMAADSQTAPEKEFILKIGESAEKIKLYKPRKFPPVGKFLPAEIADEIREAFKMPFPAQNPTRCYARVFNMLLTRKGGMSLNTIDDGLKDVIKELLRPLLLPFQESKAEHMAKLMGEVYKEWIVISGHKYGLAQLFYGEIMTAVRDLEVETGKSGLTHSLLLATAKNIHLADLYKKMALENLPPSMGVNRSLVLKFFDLNEQWLGAYNAFLQYKTVE